MKQDTLPSKLHEGFNWMEKIRELDMMEKVGKGTQKGSFSRHEKWDEKSLGWKLSQGAEML